MIHEYVKTIVEHPFPVKIVKGPLAGDVGHVVCIYQFDFYPTENVHDTVYIIENSKGTTSQYRSDCEKICVDTAF